MGETTAVKKVDPAAAQEANVTAGNNNKSRDAQTIRNIGRRRNVNKSRDSTTGTPGLLTSRKNYIKRRADSNTRNWNIRGRKNRNKINRRDINHSRNASNGIDANNSRDDRNAGNTNSRKDVNSIMVSGNSRDSWGVNSRNNNNKSRDARNSRYCTMTNGRDFRKANGSNKIGHSRFNNNTGSRVF